MKTVFDAKANHSSEVDAEVTEFLESVDTRERKMDSPIVICQDGRSESYYIRCSIPANVVCDLLDIDARLEPNNSVSFRANRELLLKHNTYKRMVKDGIAGREFNDIIVEYTRVYSPERPLKVWGGQHRSRAIQEIWRDGQVNRYHGFRVYFCLTKEQRNDLALVSNVNIAVSDDLFDRLQEETLIGTDLREWCWSVGLLEPDEDFPDKASTSERISVRLARTFIVNFFMGKEKGEQLNTEELDKNIYEPYLCESGAELDPQYDQIVQKYGPEIWMDAGLLEAGKAFAQLHHVQRDAVRKSDKVKNLKGFRNKALLPSVLSGWSYVAGLLQPHSVRLKGHLQIPRTSRSIPDPLNARGMSTYRHDKDEKTYRGLGTRSAVLDRQRMAQVFLARSLEPDHALDQDLLDQAVSQVLVVKYLERGYQRLS